MNADSLHTAMLDSNSYPSECGAVIFFETHISRLYFIGDHVYKVKKPVNFGFLDFTSLDRRHFYCREELRLNRRFCPDTYLDVVTIRKQGARYRVGGQEGLIIDYAVLMKRLPEEYMLDRMIESDAPNLPTDMQRLGRHIGMLHRNAEVYRHADGASHLDMAKLNWEENLRQTAPFVGTTLTAQSQALISRYVGTFLVHQSRLLKRREECGFVIDGHGDLHAEHICLTEPIRIYDCIEFNERFRIDDRLADLAFLLMDLEYRNRWDLAEILGNAYLEATGDDPDLPMLLPFYKIYRAWVRGKVLSFLTKDRSVPPAEQDHARQTAQAYFNLAAGYLCPPALILTCGLMGVGKSAVAKALAKALGAVWVRSDQLRKQLAGRAPLDKDRSAFRQGLYNANQTEQTYQALLDNTEPHLAGGKTVIADASFAQRRHRNAFRQLADRLGVRCLILWLDCDRETIRSRLRQREAQALDISDGRPELLEAQAAAFETPESEPNVLRIDTSKDIAYNISRILGELSDQALDPSA